MIKTNIKKSLIAAIFSAITIGVLTFLTYETNYGMFLIASFGSSMVLLYGYPENQFAQPKNIFFGHVLTATVGVVCLHVIPFSEYIVINIFSYSFEIAKLVMTIPFAVGLGVGLMILLNVTHPPAGGNPIIVIIGGVSWNYLLNPIITGSIVILAFGIVLNRLILKKKYPL
tara:strand:+ start:2759 stop:3271 length:513 start_codon:yes stop_codon:yes gene_type:complete